MDKVFDTELHITNVIISPMNEYTKSRYEDIMRNEDIMRTITYRVKYAISFRYELDVSSLKRRLEFPELRRVAKEQYDYWQPETVLVEAKASGLPLTYELRQMGIPVVNFTPSKGNDKHTRVNAVAPLFESGSVWAPKDKTFAQEVIEECAAFPYGDHDDLVDSTTQALLRFRQGGLIQHPEDYIDETKPKIQRSYYW